MRYLNSKLGPLKNALPDMYDALTIDDFLAEKDQIPKPLTWRVVDFLLNGKPRDSVLIDFYNVYLLSARSDSVSFGWVMSNGKHGLFLFPLYPELDEKEITRYQDGLYERVRVYYLPKYDRLHLVRTIKLKSNIPQDLERTLIGLETSEPVH